MRPCWSLTATTACRFGEIRDYVLSECGGMTAADTARQLEAKFGGTFGSHQVNLSRGTYGIKKVDGQWALALVPRLT